MPRSTRALAITAAVLATLWGWVWLAMDWTVTLPPSPQHGVMTTSMTPPSPARNPAMSSTVDTAPFLDRPAFYPDRRMHPYRPGADGEAAVPKTTLDFELTTTVVGTRRSFAVLRLRGGGNSVIAHPGEAFEADPSWQVTRIDRTSASFVNAQGTVLTLTIKPPAPAQPGTAATVFPTPAPPPRAATPSSASASSPPAAAPPATAVQPMQENAEVRARIEARRRENETRTQSARTQ